MQFLSDGRSTPLDDWKEALMSVMEFVGSIKRTQVLVAPRHRVRLCEANTDRYVMEFVGSIKRTQVLVGLETGPW
jgi:hypothetical protein